MQDFAGGSSRNIIKDIVIIGNKINLSVNMIRKIGFSVSSKGDLSDPGLVLRFMRRQHQEAKTQLINNGEKLFLN